MEKVIEGLWDCSYCSCRGIKGTVLICPNCHTMRSKSAPCYLPTEGGVYIKREPKTIIREGYAKTK